MSTEPPVVARRLAVVVAGHSAIAAAPPGIDTAAFAHCCLADTYEVLADLVGVSAGIVGDGAALDELAWSGDLRVPDLPGTRAVAGDLTGQALRARAGARRRA